MTPFPADRPGEFTSGAEDRLLSRFASIPRRFPAWVLYAACAAPPFLFGSRDAITVAGWCFLLGAGLLSVRTSNLRAGHLAALGAVCLVWLTMGAVLHEQLSPHPWLAWASPPEALWARTGALLGMTVPPSGAEVRGLPWFAAGPSIANTAALVLAVIAGSDLAVARRALRIAAWAGAGYAAYGIFAFVVTPDTVLWRDKPGYVGVLTSTFINRNTAAAYFGACSVVWLLLMLESMRAHLPREAIVWRKVPGQLLEDTPRDVTVRFVGMFVCLSAMFMTGSRAGIILSLAAATAAFLLYLKRDLPRAGGVLAAAAIGIGFVILVVQVMGGGFEHRVEVAGLSDAGRLSVYKSAWAMIADHPWTGTGLGTFPQAFMPYRSGEISMQGVWDIAHNTPLEFAAEMGLPCALTVAAAWVAAAAVLAAGTRRTRRQGIVPLAALMAGSIGMLHSAVDFTMQVPGFAIVMCALTGLGLAQSLGPEETGKRRRRHDRARPEPGTDTTAA